MYETRWELGLLRCSPKCWRESKEFQIKLTIVENELPYIVFNGVTLPFAAIFIDFCASDQLFPDIEDDLSLWFWRFTICLGKCKDEESSVVISHAEKLKDMIVNNDKMVTSKLSKLYIPEQVELIKQSWLSTLEMIITTASECDTSVWCGTMPTA